MSELIRRTCRAIILPHKVFQEIRNDELPSWVWATVVLVGVSVIGTNVLPYLIYGSWPSEVMLPHDWWLRIVGLAMFTFVQWLLCMLIFAGVGRCVGSRAGSIAAFGVASYYLVLGNWLIALIIDSSYYYASPPIIPLHIPWLDHHFPWVNTPFEPVLAWVRLSYFVIFPWLSVSIWCALRHLLKITSRLGAIGTGILAIVLPIMGRLFLEQLPPFFQRSLLHVGVATVSLGAMTLMTFSLFAAGLIGTLVFLLRPWRGRDPLPVSPRVLSHADSMRMETHP